MKNKSNAIFSLSAGASALMNNYLATIRKGIKIVAEMHTHDSNPSLEQADFEEIYINSILGQTAGAVSQGIKAFTDGLSKQKEEQLKIIVEKENCNETV